MANCLLCSIQGVSTTASNFYHIANCPNCGKYVIDDESLARIEYLTKNDAFAKLKIAAIAYEFNLQRIPIIISIDGHQSWRDYNVTITPEEMISRFPLNINSIIDRSLVNLENNSKNLGHPLSPKILKTNFDWPCFFSFDSSQLFDLLKIMQEMKYIIVSGDAGNMVRHNGLENHYSKPVKISLLPAGYARIQQLRYEPPGGSPQAFVAMWFDDSRRKYYTDAIAPAIVDAHKEHIEVKPIRIDYTHHNDKICDKIISEIRRSHYVVADITGNNAGAYYEAGFAQGLGIPVIWVIDGAIAKKNPMHFDIRQYNTIFYESVKDLKERLTARIASTISTKYLLSRNMG